MSNRLTQTRFGIMGTGWMADIFAKELARSPYATLVGVASSRSGRAARFCHHHPTATPYATYESLTQSDDVDVVYIATTTDRHRANAMTCIENRKAMVVEKPITMTARDTRAVLSAAGAKGLFCMEAMWMRFFPVIRDLETPLSAIGEVTTMEASFCIDVPFDANHRLYNPDLGGGALLDIGIYPLNLLHRLWGFEDATLSVRLDRAPTGVDEGGVLTFDYRDGRQAILHFSLKGERSHRARFRGTMGDVTIEDFFHPSKLIVSRTGESPLETPFSYEVMGYAYEIEEVVRCLREGRTESPLMPHCASIEINEMMDRILRH